MKPARYPTQAELTAEVDEEAPQTFLTVTDSADKVVRRLTVPGTRGMHRYVWNLRGIAPTTGGGGFGGGGGGGRMTMMRMRRSCRAAPAAARSSRREPIESRCRDASAATPWRSASRRP